MGLGQRKQDMSLKYLLLQKATKLLSLDIFSNTKDLVRIINHNILNDTENHVFSQQAYQIHEQIITLPALGMFVKFQSSY